MTFDREAARARCEAARLAVSAEECLRHGPDLLEMVCTDLPAALDEIERLEAEVERLRAEKELMLTAMRMAIRNIRRLPGDTRLVDTWVILKAAIERAEGGVG